MKPGPVNKYINRSVIAVILLGAVVFMGPWFGARGFHGIAPAPADNISRLMPQLFDSMRLAPGDSFSFTLSNNSDSIKEFYVQTVFDTGKSHIFLSMEDVIAYVKTAGDPIAQIRSIAYLIKSDRYRNYFLEPDDNSPEIMNKKYSLLWFLAYAHHQCSGFTIITAYLLQHTGAFAPDSLFEVDIKGLHTVLGVHSGYKFVVDNDCSEPALLSTGANGKFEWVNDFVNHPEILNGQNPYTYRDPVSQKSGIAMSVRNTGGYQALYHSALTFSQIPPIHPVRDSGIWRMPPHTSLTWKWRCPPYVIDTSNAPTKALMDTVRNLEQKGKHALALAMIGRALHINPDSVEQTVTNPRLFMVTGGKMTPNDIVLSNNYATQTDVQFHIAPRNKPIGTGELKLPMAIRRVTTDKPLTTGDTVIPAGTSTFYLYNQKDVGPIDGSKDNYTRPQLSAGQLQMVNSIAIPANTTVDMILDYNQLIYGFPGGIKALFFGSNNPSGLTVTR